MAQSPALAPATAALGDSEVMGADGELVVHEQSVVT